MALPTWSLRPLRSVRACGRVLGLLWHVLQGLWLVTWRFPRYSPAQQQAQVQAWSLGLLARAGVRLQVQGEAVLQGPVLLAANHLSWLDIPVLHAARYCRFISKSDVQAWPIVGTLATAGGTLYIHRESRRDALRMVHDMRQALEEGQVLAIFPEGTTGDGRDLLPFHANLLQAPLLAGAPVQPVGLRFVEAATGATSYAPSYVGDETLLGSVWRTLSAPPLLAIVHFGALQTADGRDRRAWSEDLHREVDRLRQS